MKKQLLALLSILALSFTVVACDFGGGEEQSQSVEQSQSADSEKENSEESSSIVEEDSSEKVENSVSSNEEESSAEESLENDNSESLESESSESLESESSEDSEESSSSDEEEDEGYLHTDFTVEEKAIFTQYIGEVIPFAPNDEYYVEGYYAEADFEHGVNFYTYDNTQADFENYLDKLEAAGYEFIETYVDEEYGDTWYWYEKNDIVIDVTYYDAGGTNVIDLYVYSDLSTDLEDGSDSESSEDSSIPDDNEDLQALTIAEFLSKKDTVTFYQLTGVVTKITNTTYGNFDFEDETGKIFVWGLYPYEGSTDKYAFSSLDIEVGDTIEIAGRYKNYNGKDEVVDAYFISEITSGDGAGGSGGDSSDDSSSGNTDDEEDVDLITNEGKGLPTDADGVYDVDFTQATNVKDVTDQGYYLDGCPTVGSPKILVVPVEFKDVTAASKGYSIEKIEKAFKGGAGDTDYHSVAEYYKASSGGKLTLDFVVLDTWFRPENNSSYYLNATMDYYDSETNIGDQIIIDEVLASLSTTMDLTEFDSDNNGTIDAIVLINTLEIDSEGHDMNWAYRYWNIYTDDNEEYYEYDGVSANDYLWASYQFMHEDAYGFDNSDALNTYTYIHEFGHVLGADDYYDTSYSDNNPLDGRDIMDSQEGDHNPYSKFNYGWITSSRLIVAEESVTVTLSEYVTSGDTLIIANNWDDALGAYQEYYVLMYYTSNGLNDVEGGGYFSSDCVVMYHVNASLYADDYGTIIYYDVYNNNTDSSDSYGTKDNLIELVGNGGDYEYTAGEQSSGNEKDDSGNKIAYTFRVDSISDGVATLTFTKNN